MKNINIEEYFNEKEKNIDIFINSLKKHLEFIDNHETVLPYCYKNDMNEFYLRIKSFLLQSNFYEHYDNTLNKLTKPMVIYSSFKCGKYLKYEIGNNYIKCIDKCS